MTEKKERKEYLLKVVLKYLKKLNEDGEIYSNIRYDKANCDIGCLIEDIEMVLE